MADCSDLFSKFDDSIKLSSTKKAHLRSSRNALRKKLKAKFKEKGYEVKFHQQGSLAMSTIITPVDGDYDIDDGCYMQVEEEPKESVETIHQWVVEAVEDHTSADPIDKDPCVRVIFKAGYHVDLVVYYKLEGQYSRLAHKRDGWIISEPKEFMDWFEDKVDEDGQLKRIVRYFKGWRDNLRGEMPSGLIFTILATNNFTSDERDDVAFLETMKKIKGCLDWHFVCYRPTTPNEDLFAGYSKTRKQYFMEHLNAFIQSGKQAIEEPSKKNACLKWKRHFGERFPCDDVEDSIEDAKAFTSPGFIRSDARSA